jgi:hypothetical protein
MRGWGRRSLRLSGDWFPSRLRSSSSGPPSASQGSHTPTSSMSLVPRAPLRQAPPPPLTAPATTSLPSPSRTPGPGLGSGHHSNKMAPVTATTTTPTFRQKRAPLYLTPTQHHFRVPHSRSTHTVARTRIGGGGGTSSPTPKPMVIPIQRSSSHGASFVGPVPRSARRWARSAHVHEVRRARHHQHHNHHHHNHHHDRDGRGRVWHCAGTQWGYEPEQERARHGVFWQGWGWRGGGTDGDVDAEKRAGAGRRCGKYEHRRW